MFYRRQTIIFCDIIIHCIELSLISSGITLCKVKKFKFYVAYVLIVPTCSECARKCGFKFLTKKTDSAGKQRFTTFTRKKNICVDYNCF